MSLPTSPRLGGCLALLGAVALGACDKGSASSGGAPAPATRPSATATASASAASVAPHPSARALPKPPPEPCKAATVTGSVSVVPFVGGLLDGGTLPVTQSAILPDDAWIDVAKGGKLAARDSESTRETMYEGPGRFRVCIGHREEAWVHSGTFESVGGAGERPGGEQWIATPLGVVRYDIAKLKMVVSDKAVDVVVSTGTGYLWAEGAPVAAKYSATEGGATPAADDEGWVRLDSGTGAKLTAPASAMTPERAAAALEQCVAASKAAMALTASLGEPDANLADLGPRDIVARRVAHAACLVAHLRVEALPPSPARDSSLDRVRTAEAGWRSLTPPAAHPGAVAPSQGH